MIKNNESATAIADTINDNQAKLLFFSGSNSSASINQMLVTALAGLVQSTRTNLIDLRNFSVPIYSDTEEARGIPTETNDLLEIIESHDLLIIAVPEHNSAMPAFFKNIVDWMSRARNNYKVLTGKKIILLNASPAEGGKNTTLNTRIVLEALGATVIGTVLMNNFYQNTVLENKQLIINDINFINRFRKLLNTQTTL